MIHRTSYSLLRTVPPQSYLPAVRLGNRSSCQLIIIIISAFVLSSQTDVTTRNRLVRWFVRGHVCHVLGLSLSATYSCICAWSLESGARSIGQRGMDAEDLVLGSIYLTRCQGTHRWTLGRTFRCATIPFQHRGMSASQERSTGTQSAVFVAAPAPNDVQVINTVCGRDAYDIGLQYISAVLFAHPMSNHV